jgi:23S rRNA (uracil1939-C5)-methyltransferase
VKTPAEVELTIEGFSPKGRGLARLESRTFHVLGGVPGDRVRARVVRGRKRVYDAQLLEVIEPSPLRTEPRCRYFGTCGGCRWQNVLYAAQLDAKRQSVEDAFTEHGVYPRAGVPPVLPAQRTYYYRNKMEFSFGARRWLTDWEIAGGETLDRSFALGLHLPLHFDRLLDLRECHLQSEFSAALVNGIRGLCRSEGWTPWDNRTHEGFLRHLVIRTPEHGGEVMLNLVTNGEDAARMARLASFLRDEFPQVSTLVNTINKGVAQVSTGESATIVFGPGVVHDRIGPHVFEIGPQSFFQTNTLQAERLYEVSRAFAALRADDVVYDLFSGLGTISLFVAADVRRVVGIEIDPDAAARSRRNAATNGVRNAAFIAGDIADRLTAETVAAHGRPDVVILDPPRSGLHPKVIARLGEIRPERIVYVSCNPASQAKDLALLCAGYELLEVQPVDLFPHTEHVENVASLRARAVPF